MLEERGEPFGPLGMVARRMELRERRVGQDVDRTISASSSMLFRELRETPRR